MSIHKLAFPLLLSLSPVVILAQAPLPVLRVEPAVGSSTVFIRNAATQPPLTAFLVELVHYPGSYFQLWEDDIATPIAPDVEKRIPITDMTAGAVPDHMKVTAALYADGTSSGVAEKVNQLVERRRYLLQTTRETIARLEKARTAGTSASAAAADLKQWAEPMEKLTKSSQNSQPAINNAAAKTLIMSIATQLESHTLDETITSLHNSEAAMAAGKPAI